MTTAEIRRKNVKKLAERADTYAADPLAAIADATKAMNAFYRLAGFSVRLFYINNDERLYTRYYKNGRLDEMEKQEERRIDTVNSYLAKFHARMVYNGIYPSICDEKHDNDHGCIDDLFLTAWY